MREFTGKFTATGISALFARLRVTYYSERMAVFFELFFPFFFFLFSLSRIVIKTTVGAPTRVNIVYCPVKNLKKERKEKKKKRVEVERARFRKRWAKRRRGKACIEDENGPFESKMRQ